MAISNMFRSSRASESRLAITSTSLTPTSTSVNKMPAIFNQTLLPTLPLLLSLLRLLFLPMVLLQLLLLVFKPVSRVHNLVRVIITTIEAS